MAEVPSEEESDDGYSYDEEATVFDDDALTSFRMFHQRLNGEEVEEEAEEWESVIDEDEDEDDELPAEPDAAYVAQKLAERGITFEDLVKNIMFQEHSNYGNLYSDYERRSSEVYGQFRAVITQYRPSEPEIVEPTPAATTPAPTPEPEEPIATRSVEVDFEAQPKLIKVSFIRQVSCC